MRVVESKVIVSAAVEPEQRAELERLAREGDRTLSQEIRRALSRYLLVDRDTNEETA